MSSISFNNHFVNLGDTFYTKVNPTPVANPELIQFNAELAELLDIAMDESDAKDVFSGNHILEGSEPLAMAYAGHQFGGFNPQLGDGRAILLGELDSLEGIHFDLQLKGSGRTVYSRDGDGRSALGPVLREYLVSEAMAQLDVPTTRALAAVTTGEEVARERLVPGGIITRIATSFVRVGTFQYFSAKGDVESIKKLADFVINRNYPQAREAENVYSALFQSVLDSQAVLIAKWMSFGFIHGVMNTDNMSIAGETIDYGPCAFMDDYAHEKVFSSIDRKARYAYSNQPSIGLWNLTRLAETLIPLLADDVDDAVEIAKSVLNTFVATYQKHWLTNMRAKCGLTVRSVEIHAEQDKALIDELFNIMAESGADFTLTFSHLSQLSLQPTAIDKMCCELFENPVMFEGWVVKWRQRLADETICDEIRQSNMQSVNPVYIPRNHQIEAAIRAAEDRNDFSVFHELLDVLQNPFKKQAGKEQYQLAPEPEEIVAQTFCGT